MELLSFQVAGFRSLAETGEIPVRRPTVLTGPNDGGKTASLDALGYLLGDYRLTDADRTNLSSVEGDGATTVGTVPETLVIGTFDLSPDEREQFGMADDRIRIRRVSRQDGIDFYEVFATVPEDPRLRGLADATVADLRERAQELGVEPDGDARRREAWLGILQTKADAAPTTKTWIPTPKELISKLPRYVRFSSTREPDLRTEIHQALRGAYDQLLDEQSIMGPVRSAERKLQERLEQAADDLCTHIRQRCPELVDIRVEPSVSFREGFQQVAVHAGTQVGIDVPVELSGAGRRRRMTLAVWEWTRKLIDEPGERSILIAYDEPDTHLDYGHQRELVELIRDQAGRGNVRILVATHSLNLIDKVDIADVVHLQLADGQTQVGRLLTDEHDEISRYLATISAAMGLRNSVLLHERLFAAVEGPTEAQALPILFRTATGMSLQSVGIALIAGNNNRGALEVTRWLTAHKREVQFIIDRDSASDRSTRKIFTPERLRAVGIRPEQMHLLGDPNEMEDLFTDEQWASTANEAWPRTDRRPWSAQDIEAVRGEGKFSSGLLATARENSDEGPSSKAECLVELSRRLSQPEDVPDQLRDAFDRLMTLADQQKPVSND